ncbi:helix-turn-helix domain-containing protein [Kineococcus sp. SYSU DK002]|uniref:helix-turn-helix domain-containing protein n=1 Tax=Kineococcus sp. SYSU DK002 TaxID=3383123 RepID=UPI003D7C97F1
MGNHDSDLGKFLRARRDALQPEDVGLRREPGRRVPGLRREEVARLADISSEYYLRLEQGHDHQPSGQVLAALSRALRLDAAGAEYLYGLVHPFRRQALVPRPRACPGEDLESVVAAVRGAPAILVDSTKDVVASNRLARSMVQGWFRPGRNIVLNTFDPLVKSSMPGWPAHARSVVASLRLTADVRDTRLQEIVGTLSVRDEDFRRWWSTHEVDAARRGAVPVAVDGAGVVTMRWQELSLPDRPGYALIVFTPADAEAERALDVVHRRSLSRDELVPQG